MNENNIFKEPLDMQNETSTMILTEKYEPTPLFELTKQDIAFALCSVVTSIVMVVFGIFGGFALGYYFSLLLIATTIGIYLTKYKKLNSFTVACGILALSSGAIFITTTNVSVRFFGVIMGILLLLVYFGEIINGTSHSNRQTLNVFYSAFSTVGNIGVCIKSIFSSNSGDRRTIFKVMIGFICAIPILIIVIPLLIASDDAFRGMMTNIFNNTFTTVFKLILGIFASIFVISYGFSLKKAHISSMKEPTFSGVENVYVISFLSAIALCYILYLFSQLAYFFSAFKGFLPNGEITYAQYARKGFFEMCVIAVINLGIVFSVMLFTKRHNGKIGNGTRAVATFISIFTLIIIATAISKMVLYIDNYGMTVLRITTSAFMFFLGIVFLAAILKIYISKINVIKTALLTAGLVILLLGILNVNSICAKYNYDSYISGKLKTIDVEALYNLGDEGIPYIARLAYNKNQTVSTDAKHYLAQAYLYDYFDNMSNTLNFSVEDLRNNQKNKGLSYFSIPRNRAYNELYELIEKNPQFSSWCNYYVELDDGTQY